MPPTALPPTLPPPCSLDHARSNRNPSTSRKFKLFVVLVIIVTCTLFLEEAVWKTGTKVWMELDSGTSCQIPKIDPFLKSTRLLIELGSNIGSNFAGFPACVRKEIIFKIDDNSILYRLGIEKNLGFWEDFECCYTVFHQATVPNITLTHHKIVNGEACFSIRQDKIRIPDDHIHLDVKCKSRTTQDMVYRFQLQNQHLTSKQRVTESIKSTTSEKLSVLIIGLDSVSHANFIRYMGKTHDFLMRNLSAIEFHGMNKVGRGTDDNLIALLTGCKLYHPKRVEPECELIWTEFSAAGYTTFHSEDHPHNALHIYPVVRGDKGGIGVDYDNFEYIDGVHDINGLRYFSEDDKIVNKYGCFGDQFVYDVLMNEILKTARIIRKTNMPYILISYGQPP